MLIRSESYSTRGESLPGTPCKMNEDRTVAAHKTYAVIDGATDRMGKEINAMTPGAFVADYVHRTLTNLAQQPDYIETEAGLLLAGINRAFGENLEKYHPHLLKDGYQSGPVASAAFLRLHEDGTFSYATVGDCFLVVLRKDGNISVCPPEEKPEHLEKPRLEHMMTLFKDNKLAFQDMMKDEKAQEMYLAYLGELNKSIGVINGDPNMENLMNGGRVSLGDVAALVLMTDGMLMPGLPEPEGAQVAARQILEHGISAYGTSLEAMYNKDPDRTEYPRFKHRDDMTAMALVFEEIKLN